MKMITASLAFLLTIACGHVSAQIGFAPTPLQAVHSATEVEAIETTMYVYGPRGKYVELASEHWFLIPGSVRDLKEQILGLDGPDLKLTSTRRVYVDTVLLDGYGNVVFQSSTSFQPERWDKKVGYEVPWHAGELSFQWGDMPIWIPIYEDEKPRRLPKPLVVDFQFSWVNFEDIREVQPDNHGFVDCWLAPEWDNNPAIETSIHDDGDIQLWARSAYGFKPESVYVLELQADGEDVLVELEYVDEMTVTGDPGEQIIIFFDFDMDLPPSTGGKG